MEYDTKVGTIIVGKTQHVIFESAQGTGRVRFVDTAEKTLN